MVRLICFIIDSIASQSSIRMDLMSTIFPSIWIEIGEKSQSSVSIGGFYREWSHNGEKSDASQLSMMEMFATQIERACSTHKKVLITGDAILDKNKWNSPGFLYKHVANCLRDSLQQNDIVIKDVGTTYHQDHIQQMVT